MDVIVREGAKILVQWCQESMVRWQCITKNFWELSHLPDFDSHLLLPEYHMVLFCCFPSHDRQLQLCSMNYNIVKEIQRM